MLDAVSLDHLRMFIAAADEGSFSAGGRRLRRAQSVISQTLANLEVQLGVKLFDRSSRSFRSAGSVTPMRSRRPRCFSRPTTAATSPERNCSWMAVLHKCGPRHDPHPRYRSRERQARKAAWLFIAEAQAAGRSFARSRRTCSVAPIRNTTNNTAVAACRAGASAFATRGAPRGNRVEVSVMPGIIWKRKVAE